MSSGRILTSGRWIHVMEVMTPIIIGFHGEGTAFLVSQVDKESIVRPVEPESLYAAQLGLHLGNLPKWLFDLKKKISGGKISGQVEELVKVPIIKLS